MLKNVTDTVFYVGVDDKDIDLFENQYIVPNGIAYNSYVIMDEKIAIMEKNGIEDAAYVGDIQGDCDSARFAGIKFIHAAYGFGSVKDKDAEIHTFAELLDVVE